MGLMKKFSECNVATFIDLVMTEAAEMLICGWSGGLDELIAYAFSTVLRDAPHLVRIVWSNDEQYLLRYWSEHDFSPSQELGGADTLYQLDAMRQALLEATYTDMDYGALLRYATPEDSYVFVFAITEDSLEIESLTQGEGPVLNVAIYP